MKPLTLKQAEDRGYYVYSFNNGDYSYELNDTRHLIRNKKEIANGEFVYSYNNGDYEYEKDRMHYLIRNNKEIAKGDEVF